MTQISSKLKKSTLLDHNIHNTTDKLYDPLRNIIFNPETLQSHESQSPKAARSTHLLDSYKKLSPQDMSQIKNNIYIPIDKQLIPTNDLSVVKNSHLRIIDAHQDRGEPITSQQLMKKLNQNKPKQQMVVYQIKRQISNQQAKGELATSLFNKQQMNSNLKSQIIGDGYEESWKKLSMQSSKSALKKSTIQDHNIYEKSDKLYDPLRFVINSPKNKPREKTNWTSMISNSFKQITEEQSQKIKKNILIPVDTELVASKIDAIPNKNYVMIDALEIKHAPITEQQVKNRLKGAKNSQIIYQIKQDSKQTVNNTFSKLMQSKSQPSLARIKSQQNFIIPKKINPKQIINDSYNYNKKNLRKINNFDLIINKTFHVVDTREKTFPPINQQQLKRRLKNIKEEKIIYQFENNLHPENYYLKDGLVENNLNQIQKDKEYKYKINYVEKEPKCGFCNGCGWGETVKEQKNMIK